MVSYLLHHHSSSLIGSPARTSSTSITTASHYHRQYSTVDITLQPRNLLPSRLVITLSQKNSTSNCITSLPRLQSLFQSSDSSTVRILGNSLIPVLAAAVVILFLPSPPPAEAGFLSGITGLESVPGPDLPRIESLDRFNEENQKRYAADDERIKSSPIMKQLLERSKQNREKNKQEILDKYCLRGAEWGVGDCSTTGMTPDDRDAFIAMLRKKVEGSN